MTPKARLELIKFVQDRANLLADTLTESFQGGDYSLGSDLAYLYAAIAAGTLKGFEVGEYADECSLYNMLTYEDEGTCDVPLDHPVWHFIKILDTTVVQPNPPQHSCTCGHSHGAKP